jgi:hypothetical protein
VKIEENPEKNILLFWCKKRNDIPSACSLKRAFCFGEDEEKVVE